MLDGMNNPSGSPSLLESGCITGRSGILEPSPNLHLWDQGCSMATSTCLGNTHMILGYCQVIIGVSLPQCPFWGVDMETWTDITWLFLRHTLWGIFWTASVGWNGHMPDVAIELFKLQQSTHIKTAPPKALALAVWATKLCVFLYLQSDRRTWDNRRTFRLGGRGARMFQRVRSSHSEFPSISHMMFSKRCFMNNRRFWCFWKIVQNTRL